MSSDNSDAFEKRLRGLLRKTGDVDVPALTPERLASLRALIPESGIPVPSLSLMWKRVADKTFEILSFVETSGLSFSAPVASVLRGGEQRDAVPYVETASLSLPDGELKVQVLPAGNRRAKLLLSVRGKYAEKDDLSVELSLGRRLIEARPLEQKVEFTLVGTGEFSIVLFSGDEAIGRMSLDIGETRDADDGG